MFTLYQTLGALAAIAAAPLAQALPVTSYNRIGASSNGMYIRNLAIYEPMALGHLTLDMSIEFQVDTHDMVTTCKGHWDPNGPVPQEEYIPCKNSSVAWQFKPDTYNNMTDFTIQLEYAYEDDSMGSAPYNKVTNFARANVTQRDLICNELYGSCQQLSNSTILAVVYASAA